MSGQRLTRPDFVIIGAMKCATSTLHEQLAHQANIYMSTPKEPCFFSDDDIWARGAAWYQSLFHAASASDLCGESSTHYTKLPTHPHTVARMAELLPEHTRFIYIMRHPIDRLISQYIHEWTQRLVGDSIDEAVDAFSPLVEYSRYAFQIAPFLERFGDGRVLPVFFERLIAQPQEQLNRVAAFLGYQQRTTWHEGDGAENVSSERIRKSPVRRFIASVPGLRPLLHATLSDATRDKLKSPWRMEDRPELSSDRIARLQQTFDDDLLNLNDWLAQYMHEPSALPLTCATFREIALSQPMKHKSRSEVAA